MKQLPKSPHFHSQLGRPGAAPNSSMKRSQRARSRAHAGVDEDEATSGQQQKACSSPSPDKSSSLSKRSFTDRHLRTGRSNSSLRNLDSLRMAAREVLSKTPVPVTSQRHIKTGRKKNASLSCEKTQNSSRHNSGAGGPDADQRAADDVIECKEVLRKITTCLKEAFQFLQESSEGGNKNVDKRQYSITTKIASGGFSSVFLCHQVGCKTTKYAMKVVRIDKDMNMRQQLIYEVEVLQLLGVNKYTVGLVDSAVYNDHLLYLVLELGQDSFIDFLVLYQRDRDEIEHKFIRYYFRQMARAVEYIHHNDVVHCDIKGDNFIRLRNGRLKLVDFGCATHIGCLNEGVFRKRRLGTKHYMSPEYIQHCYASRPLDVWSLGCVLYDMVHEKTPFDSDRDLKQAIVEEEPDLSQVEDSDLMRILQATLEKDYEERMTAKRLACDPYLNRETDLVPGVRIARRTGSSKNQDSLKNMPE